MTACLNHPENCTKKVLLHAWWYHPQMLGSRHWPEPVSEEASTWPMTFPAQNWVNFNDILPWFPEYSHLYIYIHVYIYIYYIYICVCVWWCHPMVMMLSHQECSRSYQHLAAVLGETSGEFEHRRYPLDVYVQSVSEWLFLGCTEAVMHWALVGNEFTLSRGFLPNRSLQWVNDWVFNWQGRRISTFSRIALAMKDGFFPQSDMILFVPATQRYSIAIAQVARCIALHDI